MNSIDTFHDNLPIPFPVPFPFSPPSPSRRNCMIFLRHLIPMEGYMTTENARKSAPLSTAGLEYTARSVVHVEDVDPSIPAAVDDARE